MQTPKAHASAIAEISSLLTNLEDKDYPESLADYLGLDDDAVDLVDTIIDDGCDDEVNRYVMKDVYDIRTDEGYVTARLYYGDRDHIIGYVTVSE